MKGIYKITNKINNKVYIGSSKDVFDRWKAHIRDLMEGVHHSYKLQKDWNEYGYKNFTFEILELLSYKDDILDSEQFWIDKYNSFNDDIGYNVMSYTKEKYLSINKKDLDDYNLCNNIGNDNFALSKQWYTKTRKEDLKQLKNHIANYFINKIKPSVKSKELYWTTFIQYENKLKGKGNMKSFITMNGESKDKRNNLCFAVNCFINPYKERVLKENNIEVKGDYYSLSLLLNWIINVSDINKSINIYIPSSRMRNLLLEWLNQ